MSNEKLEKLAGRVFLRVRLSKIMKLSVKRVFVNTSNTFAAVYESQA